MRSAARHLGLAVLLVGACALIGAAPKTEPAKAAVQAKPAKSATAKTAAEAPSHQAKPASQSVVVKPSTRPAAAAMRISRDPDAGTPAGAPTHAVIEYVEPMVEEVGVPVLNHKADGSLELILNGTGQDYATISLAKDGTRHINCAQQGHDHSAKAMRSAKAAPAPSAQREER